MRTPLLTMALLFAAIASPATAAEYPWCVSYSMNGDATNCGFVSWEQCRMTAFGAAGYCFQNPFYVASQSGPISKPRRRPLN